MNVEDLDEAIIETDGRSPGRAQEEDYHGKIDDDPGKWRLRIKVANPPAVRSAK